MHSSRPFTPSSQATPQSHEADIELERQEYLEETHVESSQYGVGRSAEEEKPRDE